MDKETGQGREGGPHLRGLGGPRERTGEGPGSQPERAGRAWRQGREGVPNLGGLLGPGDWAGKEGQTGRVGWPGERAGKGGPT